MSVFLVTFLASVLASLASGVLGSYVVIKRMAFLSGSIAHSVLGGMGLFLYLSRTFSFSFLEPIYGAFLAAILSALLMGWIHLKYKQRKDAIIASIWSTGMAIGVIFISLTPGYNVELSHFLFGNILWISSKDLWQLFFLDVFLLFSISLFYSPFLLLSLDEEEAKLQKIPVKSLSLFLLTLVALSIVILIQIIGIILVMALLTLPPMTASFFTKKLPTMMGLSSLFSMAFSFLGLVFSFYLDLPVGATIALVCSFFYLTVLLGKKKFIERKREPY